VLKEHEAVRKRAGIFDLSHMAQFELRGEGVAEWADRLTINAVGTMKPFQARYNIFCNERGGALDDVLFYRFPERWLLVVNASNAEKMWRYLLEQNDRPDVRLDNLHGVRALIAVQGPRAVEIVAPLCDVDVRAMKYYSCAEGRIDGIPAVIARTGYTGEDGYEVFVDDAAAPKLWRTLLAAGAAAGLEPAGLGARDILRLEAGMPLYGHEMDEEITPVAAGQAWALKLNKPAFVGKDALAAQLGEDRYARIAGLVLAGRVPARAGYRVFLGEADAGEVRSASLAPSVENRQIATALVAKEAAAAGTELTVEIRGVRHAARVVALPFYKRP
jgi:aminomethyltransferase